MGIYDRDYYRPQSREREQYHFIPPTQSWVFAIIVVNIMVFFADAIRGGDVIKDLLLVKSTTLSHPLEWWRLITYSFAHGDLRHIFGNMLGLFFFGPLVERKYGQREFLCFYLIAAIVSSLVWVTWNFNVVLVDQFGNEIGPLRMLGASGSVCAVVMLVVFNYPRMTVYLWGILEMPLWLLGVIFVALDVFGFFGLSGIDIVAHEAHLAGVGFAALYWWRKWRISDFPLLFTSRYWQERQRRRRFFNPKDYTSRYNRGLDTEDDTDPTQSDEEAKRSAQVDAILQKITEKGQNSLTWSERRILKRASREMQKKNRPK